MSASAETQTVSSALLNLGRISSVEGPIRSGFLGFYKAEKLMDAKGEIPEDVQYHLKRWKEFCERFVVIAQLEDKEEKLAKWLGQKPRNGHPIASRIETYVAVFSLFDEKEERHEWASRMPDSCEKTQKVFEKSATKADFQNSLSLIKELQGLVEKRLTSDKRTSEKILSGRAPLR
jgi:hypothetical protein